MGGGFGIHLCGIHLNNADGKLPALETPSGRCEEGHRVTATAGNVLSIQARLHICLSPFRGIIIFHELTLNISLHLESIFLCSAELHIQMKLIVDIRFYWCPQAAPACLLWVSQHLSQRMHYYLKRCKC